MPRRQATGFDRNRLSMIVAVLGRHAGVALGASDVFVNVAGGVRVDEPAADLAVALAIVSSARGRATPHRLACFGELGPHRPGAAGVAHRAAPGRGRQAGRVRPRVPARDDRARRAVHRSVALVPWR